MYESRNRRVYLLSLLLCTLAAFPGHALAQPTKLSTCTLGLNRNVTIGAAGCGPSVYVDQPFTGSNGLGVITIAANGTLVFQDGSSVTLDASAIVVDGVLQAGTAASPIGTANAATVVTIDLTDTLLPSGATKAITVNPGGSLLLYGRTGVAPAMPPAGANPQAPSWTYLSAPAGPPASYGAGLGVASPVAAGGATTLTVSDKVDWQPGQWIVVAGTDFSPDSAEFVLVSSVACNGPAGAACTVTLDPRTPLVNYHFGGLAPDTGAAAFQDGVTRNFGVDERAEVGLISRNVKLTSTITGSDSANGGEILIMGGFAQVALQGVEIEKFGKDRLGSYPVHFHMAGTPPAGAVVINSNSIHHSYNKCVTLHSTNGITVANNVCARAVGHLYYLETGTEKNNQLLHNLGIGAMSNAFTIPAGNPPALASFWPGDYLTNAAGAAAGLGNGYNGFGVAFTDGAAGTPAPVLGTPNTNSGFWITNPGQNRFLGNSISGCQDVGRGFWILPPAGLTAAQYTPIAAGNFAQNRAHGCYTGFDTASDDGVTGATLYTPQSTCLVGGNGGAGSGTNCDVVAPLDALTATRNRNRGIWVRASWYDVSNARLATNRDGVSLVSSGGTEGSPPGEWGMLNNAIIVGISANNPNRFGPCPYSGQNGFGGNAGCYEPVTTQGNGYPIPTPSWNLFGVMFYDGPARLETVQFVNFNEDITPYLTAKDLAYLDYYSSVNFMPCQTNQSLLFQYEGDAAIGWFQSNVNSYPPTQYAEGLTFVNVDLRHQVYTQDVENACAPSGTGGNFRDGDKFTAVLDHDQSLSGFQVVSSGSTPTPVVGASPISLNNLPFLAGPGTADECLSTGQQDAVMEGRPTSLISPYSYATLELTALTPPCNGLYVNNQPCVNNNVVIITKDQQDYTEKSIQFTDIAINNANATLNVNCGGSAIPTAAGVPNHACVALTGRNGNGIYEPKLVNGLGYTVGGSLGMPNFVSLMYGDVSVIPFQTRIGVCYKNQNATAPAASAFTVYKGSKSFGGPNGNPKTLAASFFNVLACNGLDNTLCVASGTANCFQTLCPSAPFYASGTTSSTKQALPQVKNIGDLGNPTLCPDGECWYYDQTSGLLFLNMVQEQQNASGPYSSPLGTCGGAAAGPCAKEDFYSFPAAGAELYTILVDSSSYSPSGPSACTPYGGTPDYTQAYPSNLNQLAYSNGTIVTTTLQGSNAFPHRALTNAPAGLCPTNAPPSPYWPPPAASDVPSVFTVGLPAGVTASIPGGVPIAATNLWTLLPGSTYTLSATKASGCTGTCSCQQTFTVNTSGTGFTSSGNNCCQMGLSGSNNNIGVAAPPYSCSN